MAAVNGTVKVVTQAAPAAPRPNRMTLAMVKTGLDLDAPLRLLMHGTDGVGKTTWAAGAPSPIFLGPEDGTKALNVARFPAPESVSDIMDAIATLATQDHGFKTLVIDSLDWIEPLVHRRVCEQAGVASIEEVGGGFGKGYVAAVDVFRTLMAALEKLQRMKGMNVVFIAHSALTNFKNPEGDDYQRFELKLNAKAAALVREWCDVVFFAKHEVVTAKDQSKRVKGIDTGARLMFSQRAAAYDAKSRFPIPEKLSLGWDEFEKALKAGAPADLESLVSECQRKAKAVGGDVEAKAVEFMAKHEGDAAALAVLNDRLNAKLAEKAEKENG